MNVFELKTFFKILLLAKKMLPYIIRSVGYSLINRFSWFCIKITGAYDRNFSMTGYFFKICQQILSLKKRIF